MPNSGSSRVPAALEWWGLSRLQACHYPGGRFARPRLPSWFPVLGGGTSSGARVPGEVLGALGLLLACRHHLGKGEDGRTGLLNSPGATVKEQ